MGGGGRGEGVHLRSTYYTSKKRGDQMLKNLHRWPKGGGVRTPWGVVIRAGSGLGLRITGSALWVR